MGIMDRIRGKKTAATTTRKRPVRRVAEKVSLDAPVIGATTEASKDDGQSCRWLLRPHISEKAAMRTESGVYVFDVPVQAEKISVRRAVEALYRVNVICVRMIRGKGKVMRRGRRQGVRRAWKKAVVTIKKGQKIALYEGV